LHGNVDALVALEWNTDTKTFSSLLESSANDIHAYVIRANNRKYSDSRIRSPASQDYARDIVRVKGGVSDYSVLGEIDYRQLRSEQKRRVKRPPFKPVRIGYVISKDRKEPTFDRVVWIVTDSCVIVEDPLLAGGLCLSVLGSTRPTRATPVAIPRDMYSTGFALDCMPSIVGATSPAKRPIKPRLIMSGRRYIKVVFKGKTWLGTALHEFVTKIRGRQLG